MHQTERDKATQIAMLGAILLLAFVARVRYAYDLPMNGDELCHLNVARDISLYPDSFHFPLGNRITSHPNGALYLIAAAHWLGVGFTFMIRLCFIALSLVGLLGVFFLARSFFGYKAAIIALFVASVDRYMVTRSCQFWSPPVSLFLVPWTLLVMRMCLERGKPRDWVLLGILCGIGWNLYHLFLLLPLAFLVHLLVRNRSKITSRFSTPSPGPLPREERGCGEVIPEQLQNGRMRSALMRPWPYVALGIFVLLIMPNVLWNLTNEWSGFQYAVDKPGNLGVCPRFLMLYIGDLLLCLKDPVWICLNDGEKLYQPMQLPCHWVAGLVYLGCLGWSVFHLREGRFGLLLTAVVVPGLIGTVVAIDEPMDNIRWVQCTLIPVFCLTGWVAARATSHRIGRVVVTAGMAGLVVLLATFLAGPKWGYFCPNWERAFIGRVLAIRSRAECDAFRFPTDRANAEIRELANQMIARHPDNVMLWCCLARYAETDAHRERAFQRAQSLDPQHPLVILQQAEDLISDEDSAGASQLLQGLLDRGHAYLVVYRMLVEVEYQLGNYDSAVTYARQVAALDPEDNEPRRTLYTIYNAMGDHPQAEAFLKAYVARHRMGAAAAYLTLARQSWEQDEPDQAQSFLKQAVRSMSRRPEDHLQIASLMADKLKDRDRAMEHIELAVQFGSTDATAHFVVATTKEQNGELARAIELYERAIQLAPDLGQAHFRLGVLLTNQNRIDEAREHFSAAERLGIPMPTARDGSPEPGSQEN